MNSKFIKTLVVASCITLAAFVNNAFAIVPSTTTSTEETTIESAVAEFKALSKKERAARFKEAKKVIKQYKADKKAGRANAGNNNVLAIIFAILIPPVGVVIYENKVTTKFWISLLLTLILWLPGAIYSILVVTGNA